MTGFSSGFFAGQGKKPKEYIRLSRFFNVVPAEKTPKRKLHGVFEDTPYYFGGRKMAYLITEGCISCGAFESDCPVEAIKSGDPTYTIEADTCIDCGACMSACPVDAIKPE